MAEGMDHFDEEQMRSFGLDPEVQADRIQWQISEPAGQDSNGVHDYSEDVFAFGSLSSTVARPEGTPTWLVPDRCLELGRKEDFFDATPKPKVAHPLKGSYIIPPHGH